VQEGTIQLFAAATCPVLDILLQQIAESYLLASHFNAALVLGYFTLHTLRNTKEWLLTVGESNRHFAIFICR